MQLIYFECMLFYSNFLLDIFHQSTPLVTSQSLNIFDILLSAYFCTLNTRWSVSSSTLTLKSILFFILPSLYFLTYSIYFDILLFDFFCALEYTSNICSSTPSFYSIFFFNLLLSSFLNTWYIWHSTFRLFLCAKYMLCMYLLLL